MGSDNKLNFNMRYNIGIYFSGRQKNRNGPLPVGGPAAEKHALHCPFNPERHVGKLFNLADRNRICLNGGTPNDVQAGQWQTSFSGWGDAHLRRTVNKFQRPSILQLNIEGLTASKMSVLHHLALQCEALVILLQETHCTSVERLDLPSYHLAGFSLSRKHGLATFVQERLKWILIDQSPPTS